MRSIRSKFLMLVYTTMFGMFLLLTGISILFFRNLINRDSSELLTVLSEKTADEINLHFESMERSVDNLVKFVQGTIDVERFEQYPAYIHNYMEELKYHGMDMAKVAGEMECFYVRMAPEKFGSQTGVFMMNDGTGDYISLEPTDITEYNPDDREHVGWYYEPLQAGRAIWMEPYSNKNIDDYLISYVMPLFKDGDCLGVAGMDMSMASLHRIIDSVKYGSAYAFLVGENGNIIYHPDYPSGLNSKFFDEETKKIVDYLTYDYLSSSQIFHYTRHGEDYRLVGAKLENGMILGITIPEAEVMKPRKDALRMMTLVLAFVLIMVLIISRRLLIHVIRPIQEMTEASARIAKGEFNVPITYEADNEMGDLARSIREMSREMQEYVNYIHEQAYQDAMTGVGNKAAYMDCMKLLDRKIHEGIADFAVVVFDVNGLKAVNDRLGHEYGDMLIQDVAETVKDVFGAKNIYRIGGDEFIAVLENVSDSSMEALMERCRMAFEEFNSQTTRYGTPMAASRGYSLFRPGEDPDFKTVFQRADEAMYKDKELFYRGKNDRRKR